MFFDDGAAVLPLSSTSLMVVPGNWGAGDRSRSRQCVTPGPVVEMTELLLWRAGAKGRLTGYPNSTAGRKCYLPVCQRQRHHQPIAVGMAMRIPPRVNVQAAMRLVIDRPKNHARPAAGYHRKGGQLSTEAKESAKARARPNGVFNAYAHAVAEEERRWRGDYQRSCRIRCARTEQIAAQMLFAQNCRC